jgi:hypothetical protein
MQQRSTGVLLINSYTVFAHTIPAAIALLRLQSF